MNTLKDVYFLNTEKERNLLLALKDKYYGERNYTVRAIAAEVNLPSEIVIHYMSEKDLPPETEDEDTIKESLDKINKILTRLGCHKNERN